MFCLRTSKSVSLGELIYLGFYPLLAVVYRCFIVYYMGLEYVLVFSGSATFWRTLVILEPFDKR